MVPEKIAILLTVTFDQSEFLAALSYSLMWVARVSPGNAVSPAKRKLDSDHRPLLQLRLDFQSLDP